MVIALKHTPIGSVPRVPGLCGEAQRGVGSMPSLPRRPGGSRRVQLVRGPHPGAAPLSLTVCELLSVLALRAEPRAPCSQPAPGSRGSAHGAGTGGTRRARPQLLGQRKALSAATSGGQPLRAPRLPRGAAGGSRSPRWAGRGRSGAQRPALPPASPTIPSC